MALGHGHHGCKSTEKVPNRLTIADLDTALESDLTATNRTAEPSLERASVYTILNAGDIIRNSNSNDEPVDRRQTSKRERTSSLKGYTKAAMEMSKKNVNKSRSHVVDGKTLAKLLG
jgi:hypothetical protein